VSSTKWPAARSRVALDARPTLVGESNPYGADPFFALYPSPDGSSGHRLATKILGLSRQRYVEAFQRVNLCAGPWRIAEAREAAERLAIASDLRGMALVLLGAKVCSAFGVEFKPFSKSVGGHATLGGRSTHVVLPHPSGRCRLWLEPGSYERARELVLPLIREPEE